MQVLKAFLFFLFLLLKATLKWLGKRRNLYVVKIEYKNHMAKKKQIHVNGY